MKIALLGSAPSSLPLAPVKDATYDHWIGGMPQPMHPPSDFIDDTWQIWACSPGAWAQLDRCDRFFELHRYEPGKAWFSPQYLEFLRNFRGIVYTGGVIPEIPNHVVLPIERIEAEFSSYFLHSSLSHMLAMAILEIEGRKNQRTTARKLSDAIRMMAIAPPETRNETPQVNGWGMDPNLMEELCAESDQDDVIGLWGVDMAANEEYGDQRSGCQFFILEALHRGIGVYVPPESCLLRPKPIYGLSEWNHDYIKCTQRARELNQRRQDQTNEAAKAQSQIQFLSGAIDDMNYFINTWTNPYGIPAGIVARQRPGTGLGGGITLNRPMTASVHGFVPLGAINHELIENEYAAKLAAMMQSNSPSTGTGDIQGSLTPTTSRATKILGDAVVKRADVQFIAKGNTATLTKRNRQKPKAHRGK